MNFTIQNSILILQRTRGVLKALLQNISDDWTSNNEGEKTWKLTNPLTNLFLLSFTNHQKA
jgi:hypothetical protein